MGGIMRIVTNAARRDYTGRDSCAQAEFRVGFGRRATAT